MDPQDVKKEFFGLVGAVDPLGLVQLGVVWQGCLDQVLEALIGVLWLVGGGGKRGLDTLHDSLKVDVPLKGVAGKNLLVGLCVAMMTS